MSTITTDGGPAGSSDRAKAEVMKDWDDPAIVQGWMRWHDEWSEHTAALTAAIVEALDPRPGGRLLDLACGTGEPAITLTRAVGPTGSVVATDLSPTTLTATRERIRRHGLEGRVTVQGRRTWTSCRSGMASSTA